MVYVFCVLCLFAFVFQLFDNKDMRAMIIPPIRTDYKLLDTYTYEEERDGKCDCDMVMMAATDDPSHEVENIDVWREFTTSTNCTLLKVTGGHFFLTPRLTEIAKSLHGHLKTE